MPSFDGPPNEPVMSLDQMLDEMIGQSVAPEEMSTPRGQEKVADILLMVLFSMLVPVPGMPDAANDQEKEQVLTRLRKLPCVVILNIREKKRAAYLQQDKFLADLVAQLA